MRKEKDEVLEKEFLQAIEEMEKIELIELEKIVEEAKDTPHQFSKEFEERKEAFLREVEEKEAREKKILYRFVNTPLKKAAMVAILVGVVALGAGGNSYAGKYPMVKFIEKIYNDYLGMENPELLHNNDTKPQKIEKTYELGWLPEGYKKVEEQVAETVTRYVYADKKLNKKIRVEQYCVSMYFTIKEQDGYKETKYEGNKYYYQKGEELSLVWYKDGYQLIIRGDIRLKEALKMADSLKKM